jgi:hypothetical protein
VAIEHEGSGVKLSAILGPFLDAKADHELLRAMVLAHEAAQADALEKRRESDRLRQAAKAERDRLSRESREPHDGVSSHVRVEDSSSKKDNNKEEKKERAPAAPSPRDELEKVLDPEHAAAVIDHRQRLRKPLSPHAAKLLAAKFAAFPDANAAADKMIEAGWSKIEPHWGQDRPNSTAPPAKPKQLTKATMWREEARNHGILNDPSSQSDGRVVESHAGRQNQSSGIALRYAGTGNG